MSSPSDRPANRLAKTSSPYLLQHAHNPVDWQPWGQEAIDEARRRDVPIFLSVGYSTCYWCHVMERESFEDEATARVMNADFVNIKLDREERPDLDDLYMAAVQMLTGQGGWPMSVFLEPDTLRPFWGGTYFPPRPMHGRPSFTQVLERISEAYEQDRESIRAQAEAVGQEILKKLGTASEPVMLGAEDVQRAITTLLTIFDRTHGGFGRSPKFPQPVYLELLLAARERAGDGETRAAVDGALRLTLDKMATGGIFDQIGGGFHRYSVDALWLVPHFEKMLYDQAQLLPVYAWAAKVFGDAYYARIVRKTCEYLAREMTHAGGAFYCAQDAEVDGREGLNYVWTPADVNAALESESDREFAMDVLGLGDGPNFQDPHHPGEQARTVLWLRTRPEEHARRRAVSLPEFLAKLDAVSALMLAHRQKRKQARLDDKVLAAWNGQMIAGLARASVELDDIAMYEGAARAMEFVVRELVDERGRVWRSWRDGRRSEIPGVLEDHAHVIGGLAALARAARHHSGHAADGARWIEIATRVLGEAQRSFGDAAADGFFDTRAGEQDLFVRARSTYDGAVPSGAALMLSALIDLHELTGEGSYLRRARGALASISADVKDSPVATALSTVGLLRLLSADATALREGLAARGARTAAPTPAPDEIVTVFASEQEVTVADDEPAEVLLAIEIAPGYHINAFDAGEASGGVVLPLKIELIGGGGLVAYADYPKGEPMGGAGYRVHHGRIEVPVAIEKIGAVTGDARLAITYQACREDACMAPRTVELDVAIGVRV